jgi:PKD repeat protein
MLSGPSLIRPQSSRATKPHPGRLVPPARTVLGVLSIGALILCAAARAYAEPAPISKGAPALYYFVIDRSGSIRPNNLVIPIRGALIQKLGEIAENSEVRLVLFNDHVTGPRAWYPITTNARGEISAWFDQNFRPQGDTRLFDTLGEALTEVASVRTRYSMIQLIVLSDGIEEPPVSRRYRTWRDLEPLTKDLKSSDPPFFGTWYTLGFTPRDRPTEDSGISVREVVDPTHFTIKPDLPPLKASFDWAPASIHAGESLRLIDTSAGLPESWEWALPDGRRYTVQRPDVTFAAPGDYSVTLAVRRGSNSDTTSKPIHVEDFLAKAEFQVSRRSGTVPFDVLFKDTSRGDVVSYSWDFGDGHTSDVRNPTHKYLVPGSYTPRLTITHARGGTAKSAADTVVVATAPLSLWLKIALAVAGLAAAWIALVVPFVLKPAVLPHRGVALRGFQTHDLRRLCARYRWGWLWPRGAVSIGSRITDLIRVGSGARFLAVIRRTPWSREYILKPIDNSAVQSVKTERDILGNETRTLIAVARPQRLRHGDQFEIAGETFSWIQPSAKSVRPVRASGKP